MSRSVQYQAMSKNVVIGGEWGSEENLKELSTFACSEAVYLAIST